MKKELLYGSLILVISMILIILVPRFMIIELSSLALFSVLLHNLGFAFGLGGDLISDYFSFTLSKSKETMRFYLNELLPKFKSLILVGFLLMLIIHLGELISEPGFIHLLKVLILVPIGLAGIYMTRTIPKLQLYLDSNPKKFQKLMKQFRIIDLMSLAFWILDLVLNTIFLPTHGFGFLA